MLLTAKDVSRSFGGESLFHGVSLELRRGQSLAIVSPSGTGKSTMLSILGLLQNKSSGTLVLAGQDTDKLTDDEKAKLRRLKLGFIFQHTQLAGSLRALDNVLVPARLLHRGDKVEWLPGGQRPKLQAFEDRARELLESFGLGNRIYHYPHQLSVGQKRRVAVARALLLGASLILADEPTNDLDAASAKVVADALFNRVAAGCGLVFATHDLTLANRADAVLKLGEQPASPVGTGSTQAGEQL
jgi:ABC-type lipoprotein export system ATPase subunit